MRSAVLLRAALGLLPVAGCLPAGTVDQPGLGVDAGRTGGATGGGNGGSGGTRGGSGGGRGGTAGAATAGTGGAGAGGGAGSAGTGGTGGGGGAAGRDASTRDRTPGGAADGAVDPDGGRDLAGDPAPDLPADRLADAAAVDLAPGADPEPGRLAGITAGHNLARAMIPVPPLLWDPAVAATAQAYADRCVYSHSGADGLGENLAAFAPPGSTAASAVQTWVDERGDYDAGANRCAAGKSCGHYTQVVWRSTTRLGCAVATCDRNSPFGASFPRWDLWVCNYAPPGNFVGQRPF
jgi:hypothetical protein